MKCISIKNIMNLRYINEIYDKHNHPSNQRTGLSYQNVSLKKRTETEQDVIKSVLSKYKMHDVSVTNIEDITMLQNHIAGGG